jgi:tight adherence protein B
MTLRRASTLVLASVAALCLAPSGNSTAEGIRLRPASGTAFPDRAYVLSLPADAYLAPGSVKVRENGAIVQGVGLVPVSAAKTGQFGVVLVIDTSDSMHGSAIVNAVAAARAFAAHRQPAQAMAIVTFNSKAHILLPLTTDGTAIDAALANTPPLARATHIYDAVALAVSMLQHSKITVGSVVVLSDGADTGSATSLAAAAAAAKKAGVRVFSVGLRSHVFKEDALKELARSGGGDYSEARTSADLAPIFSGIGARLASEYLIRYRSAAPPNRKVFVAVTVKGYEGAATAGYVTPSLSRSAEAPFNRSLLERFVRSAIGMVVTAFAAGLLVACGLLVLVRPRNRGVRKRLAEFVSLPLGDKPSAQARKEQLFERAERSFEGTRWWGRFKEELDVARIRIPAIQIVFWTVCGTLILAYLVAALAGTAAGFLALLVPIAVRSVVTQRADRDRERFAEQLPDNLQVLASALRAGHSLAGALSVVVEDSPDPSRREFRRVVADEQLGVPLEDAFEVVARRMKSRDVMQVGLVAALQHETGGNTAEVLDRVADTVRERFDLRRLVKTLTAQGRLSRWILTILPIFLLVSITLLNPSYIAPLYNHSGGRVLLAVAAVMITAGSLVIRRIINIKV